MPTMTYLDPQTRTVRTVSPDWSWAGEQGCFWFWLFAQHLCGSQDSWALNKCFGWCFPFYANSSNGQCTSMGGGLPYHLAAVGKIHPLSFQDSGHFYSNCWQGGNIGNNEVCSISFLKSHFAVTPCNPCNAWAVKSAVTLCCCRETGNWEKLPHVLFSVFFPFVNMNKSQIKIKAGQTILK